MKYKTPFQYIDPFVCAIILRESSRQNLSFPKATKQQLMELAQLARLIEKDGLPHHLVCKKLPNQLGHGIFLHPNAKPLLKGQIIGIYTGETQIIPQYALDEALYAFEPLSDLHLTKEEQHRFSPKKRYHPRRLYAFQVDAEKKGNFTRFINHSEKPNVIAELMQIPKNSYNIPSSPLTIAYCVHKTIKPGEQLLINYDGDDHSYWNSLGITPFPLFPKTFRLGERLRIQRM